MQNFFIATITDICLFNCYAYSINELYLFFS